MRWSERVLWNGREMGGGLRDEGRTMRCEEGGDDLVASRVKDYGSNRKVKEARGMI